MAIYRVDPWRVHLLTLVTQSSKLAPQWRSDHRGRDVVASLCSRILGLMKMKFWMIILWIYNDLTGNRIVLRSSGSSSLLRLFSRQMPTRSSPPLSTWICVFKNLRLQKKYNKRTFPPKLSICGFSCFRSAPLIICNDGSPIVSKISHDGDDNDGNHGVDHGVDEDI